MYIKNIIIKNFRCFSDFTGKLSKMSVIVGENEAGKSNLFSALTFPLGGNDISFTQKRLKVSDINTDAILSFYSAIINNEPNTEIIRKIPKVSIQIDISSPENEYEEALLQKWLSNDESGNLYSIKYEFAPKDDNELIEAAREVLSGVTDIKNTRWFTLPTELYDYQIISTNNGKQISFNDLKKISINTIQADRDDFSESSTMKANSVLTKMLTKTLDSGEKAAIDNAYTDFFKAIEGTETFEKIFQLGAGFENFADHVKDIECIPNLPNLKNILSNITLKSGEEFLYQRGLGERNLIYIILLFDFYKKQKEYFNLCCIEEPEAHLSINNLRLAVDYIYKSNKTKNGLLQTLVSSHNPWVINKLELSNVLILKENKTVSLEEYSQDMQDYLRKRPNFDILKLLFSNRVILVEGPTEEMLINAYFFKRDNVLNTVDVIALGHKGYTKFLDIWLTINEGNPNKKIAVIRDFDNQPTAKSNHDTYDTRHDNICVRTTVGYTLEDDLANANTETLRTIYGLDATQSAANIAAHMKALKTENMLEICDAMLREENPITLILPAHIQEAIDFVA